MQASVKVMCSLRDDAFTRRVRKLCAMQGWHLISSVQLSEHVDLVFVDSYEDLPTLHQQHPKAVFAHIGNEHPAASDDAARLHAVDLNFASSVADHQLVDGIITALNLHRFRQQFSPTHAAEPITRLPRHAELLVAMDRYRGQAMSLLIVQIDHAEHLYANLDPVSKTDLLSALGNHLQSQVPGQAFMGIFDAACFAVWLPHGDASTVNEVVQKVLHASRSPISFRSGELHFSVSIGAAFHPSLSEPQALWQEAWRATETALELGGNRSHFVQSTTDENCGIAQRIPQAIDRDEFSLVLQPQFNIAGEQLTGVETLLRWQGLEVGNLFPEHFIPVAERHGQMARVGDWVLERSCIESASWFEHVLSPISIGVNTSPAQFHNGAIARQIERLTSERWLNPATLELELSHADLLHVVDRHRETLYALRDVGVRIAIDNLGVGVVDTPKLLRCPADTLKIDRSLIGQIENDNHARDLVEHITGLGQRFDLRTVAVGVESAQQRAMLASMGCSDAQGFLFSAPIAMGEFQPYLAKHSEQKHTHTH